MNINLKHLKIPLANSYLEGKIASYRYKSIHDILQDQQTYELLHVREWLVEQILVGLEWSLPEDEVTPEMIQKGLSILESLNIKPKGCIYEETEDDTDSVE